MHSKLFIRFTLFLGSCLMTNVALAAHQAEYYCGQGNLEFKETISVGKATEVRVSQGAFMQIESPNQDSSALDYLANSLDRSGLSQQCIEYLEAHSKTEKSNTPELLSRVYFSWDKSELTDKSRYILAQVLKKVADRDKNLLLKGYTDNTGSKQYNYELGLRRSQSVLAYLAKHGLSKGKMHASSKGEADPVASNAVASGREKNRRVEIDVQ
ncbi:OmpA family protein [Vibrio neonatus]|uniref:OmpA family protein n=1 Tax=Vibrio neonatus TaxID=278860 RepID=UPI0021C3D575|nr:OmpA family protein [Vibrio neonatus]